MIRRVLFLTFFILTLILTENIYVLSTYAQMGTPPSPSYSFVMSPHLHISEKNTTYTVTEEVLCYNGAQATHSTKWKPSKPSTVIGFASRATVNGFGRWRASLTSTHEGHKPKVNNFLPWADFGSVGTLGPVPTWRKVENLVIGSFTIWAFETVPYGTKK